MTSIYSGNLMRTFVKDQNTLRRETFNVNRYDYNAASANAQGRLEKELKEGLESHQAFMADLQTRANELTEKLNNLYRRFQDNLSFSKAQAESRFIGTSGALNNLPDINDPSGLPNDYPTGVNEILPFGDPGRIRNYSYNPYFGSKAIDESDQNVLRTYWEQPGTSSENTYRENGAFWNAVSYLWSWDVDRINAAYATTTNQNTKQVNVTALQPNKPQQPPLRPGDRFPMNWSENPLTPGTADFPAVNITGLRPGGVDFSHASDSLRTANANANVVGENSINWGWEFDDLPLALEVTSVSQQPDGNTVPTGFKVVYNIPPDHPFYEDLKVLNGTEPMIIDAPTELRKERIDNAGFSYTGTSYFPGSNVVGFQVGPRFRTSRGQWVTAQPGENEYSAPGNYTIASGPIAAFELETCIPDFTIDTDTRVSFQYRYRVHQNSAAFGSTWDDSGPGVPSRFGFSRHDWNSAGDEAFGGGNTFGVFMPGGYQTLTNQPGETYLLLGQAPSPNNSNTDYLKVSGNEQLYARVVDGSADNTVRVEFYFEGDLNQLEIEVTDFQIVTYDGDFNTWTQGKHNAGNLDPLILEGDPEFVAIPPPPLPGNPDTQDVVSKYYPNVYQFTQFNDQYTNSATNFDRNDIVRSPWEFGVLNVGEGSGLTGEMWLDLNGRRLNLDHDAVDNQAQAWGGTTAVPVSAGTAIVQQAAVDKAYDFIPADRLDPLSTAAAPVDRLLTGRLAVEHPDDDCGPNPSMIITPGNTGIGGDPGFTTGPTPFFNPSAPTGGIRVDSVVGFTVGDQVLVNGNGPYTITAIVDDAGSPAETTTDPEFDDPAIPSYVMRAPFDGSFTIRDAADTVDIPINNERPIPAPPAPPGPDPGPIPLGAFPVLIDGVEYADYAEIAAAFPAAVPAGPPSTPVNTVYWAVHTESTSPFLPARREIYLNALLPINPTAGAITPVSIAAEDPRVFQFADADPLSNFNERHILRNDETLDGEDAIAPLATPLDPGRTANPLASDGNNNGFDWADPNFYNVFGNAFDTPFATTDVNPTQFITGTSTDAGYNTNPDYANVDGTIDRVGGADLDIQYKISIPTADVNVLRKENNLMFNLGSIDERDWGVSIVDPYMEFRTAPAYQTVARYRVDAGGNIYDRFGKGYYEDDITSPDYLESDAASVNRLYTKQVSVPGEDPHKNNQVSNSDKSYDYSNYEAYDDTAGNFESFINGKNRLSMNGDDYNLFDYVPDLNLIPGNTEGASFGEAYVGSLPTNFYYYREGLDDSQSGSDTPFTAGVKNGDKQAALNFNGNNTNRSGVFNEPTTTVVHNTEMPAWVNVKLGVAEQDARIRNQERTTTWASWDGFQGADTQTQTGRSIIASSNVDNASAALGQPNTTVAFMNPASTTGVDSSITLDMNQEINRGGHLLLHEFVSGRIQPHAIPLPLRDLGDFPDSPSTSYTFAAYGNETVTRTGSRYITNFGTAVLDGLDGEFDSNWTAAGATGLLQAAGAQVSTTHPPAGWGEGLIMHVDDASAFSVDSPQNQVYLGVNEGQRYRIGAKNVNSSPHTLFLIPEGGSVPTALQTRVHADLQVRQFTGQYTVSVVNGSNVADANGKALRIDYDDRGTNIRGQLDAVQLSSEMDRVGRLAGDDVRTTDIETNRIGPEVFDAPQGYIQSDARMALNLVSKDKDGNPTVKKLRSVQVSVDSGEQIIPFTSAQNYSTEGPFAIDGTWPIALFDDDRQLNPEVTADINVLVGLRQGISNGAQATDVADPRITVVSTAGFARGEDIYINGQLRKVADVSGNDILLDAPLSTAPRVGDVAYLGKNDRGERDLALFLNKSYAMSAGAPVRIELIYDEYEVVGYPPSVDLTTPVRQSTERLGFSDADPTARMQISSANTGTGTPGNPIVVDSTVGFADDDIINIQGQSYRIVSTTANTLVIDNPINPPPTTGEISRTDYDNYLVVGKGRTGGSYKNEFTTELKRIMDDPSYQEVLRHDILKNIFITASVTDPFNDLVASKIFLNWDRRRRSMDLQQVSFSATYTRI